jgi:hypothetical protein
MIQEMRGNIFLEVLSHELYLLKVISELTKTCRFLSLIIVVPIEGTITKGIRLVLSFHCSITFRVSFSAKTGITLYYKGIACFRQKIFSYSRLFGYLPCPLIQGLIIFIFGAFGPSVK